MTSTSSNRHDKPIGHVMVEPVPEDEVRDTLGKRLYRGRRRFADYPVLAARYAVNPEAVSPSPSEYEDASDDFGLSPEEIRERTSSYPYEPRRGYRPTGSSSDDIPIHTRRSPLTKEIESKIRLHSHRRFDRRFIEFGMNDDQSITEAVTLVQGGNGRKPVFQEYVEEVKTVASGDTSTPTLTAAFNEIANMLLRHRPKPEDGAVEPLPFFHTSCHKAPQHNPDLRFLPGHGEDKVEPNGERPLAEDWHDVRPDIIVWKDPKLDGGIHWGRMASLLVVKKEASSDLKADGPGAEDASLLQLLTCLAFLAYENPITGRTCGVSACGQYLRLVISDSLSWSTTRLCDMMNSDHARDIVLLVAFLLGPLEEVIDTYHPPEDKFTIKNAHDDGSVEYEWVPVRDDAPGKRKAEGKDIASRKKMKGMSDGSNATSHDSGQAGSNLAHSTHTSPASSSSDNREQVPSSEESPNPCTQRNDDSDVFAAKQQKTTLRSASRAGSDQSPGPEPASSPWRILERRRDLWGRRTVILAGMARRVNTEGPVEPMVVKFVWSPPYLRQHELRMLSKISEAIRRTLGAKEDSSLPQDKLREALHLVESEVAALRPVALGMLNDCNVKSRAVPSKLGVEDGFERDQSVTHVHLQLSAMCTRNSPGERIEDTTPLTMQQRGRVLLGTFASLWLAACSDIHYRDINTGNILFWKGKDGVVYGFLVDYGNARELDECRMWISFEKLHEPKTPDPDNDPTTTIGTSPGSVHEVSSTIGKQEASTESGVPAVAEPLSEGIQLRLDDARSANVHFISTTVHQILAEYEARKLALGKLHDKENRLRADPHDDELQSLIMSSRGRIEKYEETISQLPGHRYIDDLESAVYAHIYQVSAAVGEELQPDNNEPAEGSIRRFDDRFRKTAAWKNDLYDTLECIDHRDNGWETCIVRLVQKIRQTRQTLNQQGVIQPQLTSLEHECFKDCLAILKSSIAKMGDKPVQRVARLGFVPAESQNPVRETV